MPLAPHPSPLPQERGPERHPSGPVSEPMRSHRRDWLRMAIGGIVGGGAASSSWLDGAGSQSWAGTLAPEGPPLAILGLKVTPIAVPDPPLLAASGCHGPYFLRNVVEVRTEGGIVGIGETHGGEDVASGARAGGKGGDRPERVWIPEVCSGIAGAGHELLRGDRAGLSRRLCPCDGSPSLRAGGRAGARLGRVRRVPVLPLRRRSCGRS